MLVCCPRFDKAHKKSKCNAYFPWLLIGYGTGEYLFSMFLPIMVFTWETKTFLACLTFYICSWTLYLEVGLRWLFNIYHCHLPFTDLLFPCWHGLNSKATTVSKKLLCIIAMWDTVFTWICAARRKGIRLLLYFCVILYET